MEELKKIDFQSPPLDEPAASSSQIERKNVKLFSKKKLGIFPIVLLIIIVAFVVIVAGPLQKTYTSAKKTYDQARKAWDAVKKQNIELADEELAKTKIELEQTQKDLHSLSYMRFIPIAAWYYNDAEHLVNAGFRGLESSKIIIDSIKPYQDLLGFKGKGTFVMGSAEQRIQTAILTLSKITPRIDEVSKSLVIVQKEIDQVDPNHYPPIFGGDKIRQQIKTVKAVADEGIVFVTQARPLIKLLPLLLGESKEKKYLILFQNDKELRPTGGFITAYAIFRVDKGVIHVERSDDIYNLDNSIRVKRKAPDPILKYLPLVSTFNIRDSNLSPDFTLSMKMFNSLYEDASVKVDVDGIIALDTKVLISTIKILDDEVWAGGMLFNTQIDKRCNCPQVIYKLESLISTPKSLDLRVSNLAAVQAARKDMLGVLLYAIMEKALKSSPKKYWGPLVQQMIMDTNEKHVLFYLYNKDAQAGIEALNAAGRIVKFDGDYLHINDANMGGAKSNLFVKESVEQKYSIGGDGSIEKTVTISYKNPVPPSDCNLERGSLCLNGVLRDWVRVYVPKGSTIVNSKGSEVKVATYDELDKTVFEGFLTVRPLGSATYTLTYLLPFKLSSNSPLPLLIQKQPGTYDNQYTILVNGRTVEKFPLVADKKITISR